MSRVSMSSVTPGSVAPRAPFSFAALRALGVRERGGRGRDEDVAAAAAPPRSRPAAPARRRSRGSISARTASAPARAAAVAQRVADRAGPRVGDDQHALAALNAQRVPHHGLCGFSSMARDPGSRNSFAKLISVQTISTTDLAHRLRPVIARLARRMRQQAGGDLEPDPGRRAGHDRLPRAADAVRARRARADPAPDRDARAGAAGGGGADRARRRSRRSPLLASSRSTPAGDALLAVRARAQGRVSGRCGWTG